MEFQNLSKDPKVAQFLEQLDELADHYQLQMSASLRYTASGIIPVLNVLPKVPNKMPIKNLKTNKRTK